MHIAIEGCCHGALDKIYETLKYIEEKEQIEISILLCCGDFESIRDEADLQCMAVPEKYKSMQDFWQYYTGVKKAPYLTVFIGGNHEASNHLQELPYGGWAAPNIYYLGYAGVINFKGLRISGISGIFKQHDYSKGHYEKPPYSEQTKRSVYHIRNTEVFRCINKANYAKLKQLKLPMDIMMSHDWPNGIVHHGDKDWLIRKKRHFEADISNNQLGSLPAWQLLNLLQPRYWFSGHLHVKFAAMVEHDKNNSRKNKTTHFLALDKCLPRRDFLQVLNIESTDNSSDKLMYDAEWLAVLKHTNGLMSTSEKSFLLPTKGLNEKWDYSVDNTKMKHILDIFDNDLTIPDNFQPDPSCIYNPENHFRFKTVQSRINPQTTEFCAKLEINDPLMMLQHSVEGESSFNSSSWMGESETSSGVIVSNVSINPDEIDIDDDDDDEENSEDLKEVREVTTSDPTDLSDPADSIAATSLSSMSSAEEEEDKKKKHDYSHFKTPIRLAANFSMNLPQPVNTPLSSTPLPSQNNDIGNLNENQIPFSDSMKKANKRSSDTDSELSENSVNETIISVPLNRKFKRRNQAIYLNQSEDDAV